jgi:hypothetical protein
MTIITLSLIPSRFHESSVVLNSLLAQDLPNTKIEVYIPKTYRRFPAYKGHLPDVPKGVEICVVDEDLGPATKILYAAEKYKNNDVDIIFCDDDRHYNRNWARGFAETRAEKPDCAIVSSGFDLDYLDLPHYADMPQPRAQKAIRGLDFYRHFERFAMTLRYGSKKNVPWDKKSLFKTFRKPGFVAIGEGYGGFMVKPRFFDKAMWDIPAIMWSVDDVWLSGHLDRQGIGIWAMAKRLRFQTSDLDTVDALHNAIIDGADRKQANVACAQYMQKTYGAWGG